MALNGAQIISLYRSILGSFLSVRLGIYAGQLLVYSPARRFRLAIVRALGLACF